MAESKLATTDLDSLQPQPVCAAAVLTYYAGEWSWLLCLPMIWEEGDIPFLPTVQYSSIYSTCEYERR